MKHHILTLAASALMLAGCVHPQTDSGQRREKTNDKDRYNNNNLDKPPTGGESQFLRGADGSQVNKKPDSGTDSGDVKPIDTPATEKPDAPPVPPAPTNPAPDKPNATAPPTSPDGAPPAPAAPNIPYGKPVPGKKGFVTSPFDASAGMIDVRDIPPGTKVKDPYTGKVFLVP